MTTDTVTPLLLRPAEAAEALGIGRSKLYELLASGQIGSIKVGRARRVLVTSLQDFVRHEYRSQSNAAS